MLLAFLLGGCAIHGPTNDAEARPLRIKAADIEIGAESMIGLGGKPVVFRTTIEETAYKTFALYPKGKVPAQSDSGKCIDLVYDRRLKERLNLSKNRDVNISGHFVFLSDLPTYTISLRIDGISHHPVCQIFSPTTPYPYFVVRSVR